MKIYDEKTVYSLAHGFLDGAIKKRIEPVINNKNSGNDDFYGNTRCVIIKMEKEAEKRLKKGERLK